MTHDFSHYERLSRQQRDALYLYVDIETIPSQDLGVSRAIIAKHATEPLDESTIKPAANLKDPAKIAEDLERRLEKARQDQIEKVTKAGIAVDEEYRRTALDASTGHIACACVALGEGQIFNVSSGVLAEHDVQNDPDFATVLTGEKEMLEDLFTGIATIVEQYARTAAIAELSAAGRSTDDPDILKLEINRHRQVPVVVAHHAQFDIRYIWQRAVILGVTPPSWWPIDARPWDQDRVQDTMLMWAGVGNRIGLDRLCRALGLAGKSGVDGSMVWDLVRNSRIDDVVDYCDDDVRRLRSVHRRILGLPVLEIDAIGVPPMVTRADIETDEEFKAGEPVVVRNGKAYKFRTGEAA